MKALLFVLTLNLLSAGLLGQVADDSVFSESEIILKTSTGDISGTLTVPASAEVSPVVLIVAGSGPTDRNCNSPLGVQTNAYKMLAEGFAGSNISTLRFDKRGIGKSQMAMTSESDLRFETYVDDVVAWISLLKADKRFSGIFLLGHSEGSLISIIAAQQAEVAGFISVAGVGIPADKLLQDQLKNQLPLQLLDESNRILDSLKAGKTVSNVNPNLAVLYRPGVQPYMISWIKYDPAKELKKLTIPVCVIQGTTDLQVPTEHAKLLSASKPDATLFIVENMNHVLKEAGSDIQENRATYTKADLPLKSGLVKKIVHFIIPQE
ncbi:alpha/beta fold hydrolase [Mariniphaga sediminis]|uniref:Alpha/beta fold hydrolase n=1 Tax=Mariniphaga sediminis TaxID=1628158 RepID=A0A399D0L8_9BACT|nr:alpha/beta hydrolase [Mariniphaga sediminis]RIH65229.1 alpha/beta fold hydrolase [Mariniphaga sediminis]